MATSDLPAAVEAIVTSAAIIVGGCWAGWKWGYGETLRRRREMPDPDGMLTATSVSLSADKAYLTLQALWRNRGVLPIKLCTKDTFAEQYELNESPPVGSLRMAGYPGVTKICTVPMQWAEYTMGPQTESVMTEHFVVATDSIYAFRWQICLGLLSKKDSDHSKCDRELIWRSEQAVNGPADH